MNKKISTLFTAGLLMTGALLNSVNAQTDVVLKATAATKVEDGKKYVMVLAPNTTSNTSNVYGFSKVTDGVLTPGNLAIDLSTANTVAKTFQVPDGQNVADYVWKVAETQSTLNNAEYSYGFENLGQGAALRAVKTATVGGANIGDIVLDTKLADDKVVKTFVFKAAYEKYGITAGEPLLSFDVAGNPNKTATAAFKDAATPTPGAIDATAFLFYELIAQDFTTEDGATELNSLYNGSAFSFKVKEPASGVTVAGNVFGDKRVVAYYLENPIDVPDTQGKTELKIPAGMYFFTDIAGELDDAGTPNVDNWLNSTVIAVSSTETLEVTNDDRAKGLGFKLVEAKIKDMNLYGGSASARLSSKEELPVANANFTLWKDFANGDYAYGLQLKGFRYQGDSKKDDHKAASIVLGSRKISDVWSLVSAANSDPVSSIFALAESTAVKGITLLNTTAKAAVYNIRLINDDQKITSLNDKYLTQGFASAKEWAAKSKIFTNLDYPSYQFVISEIATNGTGITFKNRESGETLTATLYPTDTENVYEWSVTAAPDAQAIYSKKNTYGEVKGDKTQLNGCFVELIKVEDVDSHAGFEDAEDGSLVTLAFARDNYVTSNKLYTTVNFDDPSYKINADGKFVSTVEEAAQWRLVKGDKPNMVTRTIAYNKSGKVAYKANADTIIANKYALEYVIDGQAKEVVLDAEPGTGSIAETALIAIAGAKYYSIKENVDGSISFLKELKDDNTAAKSQLTVTTDASLGYKYVDADATARDLYVYNADDDVRTYLIGEAIEISYPAKEGHVSLESEMGNYISKDAENAAIVVENEANTFYLHVADVDAIVPSFYISCSLEGAQRMYMFNPADSITYYVGPGKYDRKYQWGEKVNKVLFKQASINESRDTLTTSIKGETKMVAAKPDNNNKNVVGGLENFKYNIIQAPDADGMYVIRSNRGGEYLFSLNEKLTWTGDKSQAMKFAISPVAGPVGNESIEAGTIKVVAGEGNVTVYGAAGKKVTVSDVLGKTTTVIATSDSQVISAAQGIAIIAVEGEAAVKAVVK